MLSDADRQELEVARNLLEHPGLAAKLTSLLGTPLEKGFALLPARWHKAIQKAVDISLQRALKVALATLGLRPAKKGAFERFHKMAVVGTGGLGGAFGLAGLPVELPVSTTLMLRSIADIARSEGENLNDPEAKLACMSVFAFGGPQESDDAAETGYYAVRAALASSVADAARHLAQKGLAREGAPALVRFLSVLSSRFGIIVSEKVAAMAIPAIGALGGATINALFIDHFQNMARGHFKIRKLERRYGKEIVEQAYRDLNTIRIA